MQAKDSRSNSRRFYRSAGNAVAVWKTGLEALGSNEPSPEEVQAHITCRLAGILAEARYIGRIDWDGAAEDLTAALELAFCLHSHGTLAEVQMLIRYCFAIAQGIIDRPEHWEAICALADSLGSDKPPAHDEVTRIINESVLTHLECNRAEPYEAQEIRFPVVNGAVCPDYNRMRHVSMEAFRGIRRALRAADRRRARRKA